MSQVTPVMAMTLAIELLKFIRATGQEIDFENLEKSTRDQEVKEDLLVDLIKKT